MVTTYFLSVISAISPPGGWGYRVGAAEISTGRKRRTLMNTNRQSGSNAREMREGGGGGGLQQMGGDVVVVVEEGGW